MILFILRDTERRLRLAIPMDFVKLKDIVLGWRILQVDHGDVKQETMIGVSNKEYYLGSSHLWFTIMPDDIVSFVEAEDLSAANNRYLTSAEVAKLLKDQGKNLDDLLIPKS